MTSFIREVVRCVVTDQMQQKLLFTTIQDPNENIRNRAKIIQVF